MKIKLFKGVLYKNIYFYNLQNFLKRGKKKNLRFKKRPNSSEVVVNYYKKTTRLKIATY